MKILEFFELLTKEDSVQNETKKLGLIIIRAPANENQS